MRGVASFPTPELTGDETRELRELLEQRARVVPFCRVADLVAPRGPFSRPTVYRYLSSGQLRARRLDGLTLVELESVRELLARAERWSPPPSESRPVRRRRRSSS